MAGFRIGRGRDNRTPQQGQQQPRQQPYGTQAPPPPYGQQPWPPTGGNGTPYTAGRPAAHQDNGGYGGAHGEPEYFGDPYNQPQQPHRGDPYANNPGHTQAFSINEDPYGDGNTYRAGQAPAQPAGPRLHWKDLLGGIVLRPGPTFWQMRDYPVWGPALIVTFLYGLLALFGFDQARDDAIHATLSAAVPYVVLTGVGFVIGGLVLGAVTHTLARQLGGDGAWQPTVGLSMLIMSITDAPRLIFALFLGGENSLVQVLGWVTWLASAALFTSMVSKSHDLPWPKALGASAIQLIALLSIIKLGTI
ncbi:MULTISPECIES: YIP1 family protein [unclassified Streptomyces]|uniref:YIP1 family protein n=1 Tax=unclassified Streptomyces TaxID=2593676 RepID=UPI002DDAB354|nr:MULTISPECIES: YIP1 family protein [unclassified Streptomyces]WSC46376.1 YIP1 family protein [Streptomyces sp. NBC_01762]WSC54620.1 YIP1 family protein [Streptomyces sp. NBC_01761]WSD26029.1 YIP1 family protein [Streptomyces sp. NBC_01751]WSJ52022.1 YIP1 family protein [Streptomyces sp. NBC_01318]